MTEKYENIVFYDMDIDDMYVAMEGIPVEDVDEINSFKPAEQAYEAWSFNFHLFEDHPELLVTERFSLEGIEGEEFEESIALIEKLNKLRLLITNDDFYEDITQLLEAAPQLEGLVVYDEYDVSPCRHNNLKQLVGEYCNLIDLLQACSFPNLEVLEVGDVGKQFVHVFNQIGFSKLKHFGVMYGDSKDTWQVLQQLSMPESVFSLMLSESATDKLLKRVASLPWAAQLTHLTLRQAEVSKARSLSTARFPALKFLKWVPEENDELPELFFEAGLSFLHTLDLQHCGITNETANRLLYAPITKSLKVLKLDSNHITDDALLAQLGALNCEVTLTHQREPDADYDDDYE